MSVLSRVVRSAFVRWTSSYPRPPPSGIPRSHPTSASPKAAGGEVSFRVSASIPEPRVPSDDVDDRLPGAEAEAALLVRKVRRARGCRVATFRIVLLSRIFRLFAFLKIWPVRHFGNTRHYETDLRLFFQSPIRSSWDAMIKYPEWWPEDPVRLRPITRRCLLQVNSSVENSRPAALKLFPD